MANIPYRVRSESTQYCPVTDNEVNGHIVETQNGAGGFPPNSILFFNQPVHEHGNVIVNITGPGGLFVALPEGAHEGTQVIWSQKPYLWEVIPTNEDGHITYQFIPANGGDLYIFDEFGIGQVLAVKPGQGIMGGQSQFYYCQIPDP
ncbi:hypothetical protein BJ165DRAFT_1611871 [Panaeolus papilionaceus]|nr:hypothetical protein BJ165DRAFT_1611871 [Panaeolus papilionaceus]